MKIAFGTTVIEKGFSSGHMDGIGVYAKNLWEEFRNYTDEDKLRLQAVSFGKWPDTEKSSELLGDVIRTPRSYAAQSALSIFTGKTFSGADRFENDTDIFFAPDHHIPKLQHTPVIVTIMDAYPLIYPRLVSQKLRRFKNMAFKRASHWADRIITISQYSKRDISKYFDIEEEKISIVPLGVNRSFFHRIPEPDKESVRKKYDIPDNFFIFVGTIQPRKNLSSLIEAYLSLPPEIRQKHHLVIIGQYGWGEDTLVKKLENTDEKSTIRWLKNINDRELLSLLQSALAMVYPSLYEGFGLPVLEGFASEIPVITSPSTSIPEVAGDAALYADPLDTKSIATKMLEISQDPGLRNSMIKRGAERVKPYSWENSARKHIEIFQDIIR